MTEESSPQSTGETAEALAVRGTGPYERPTPEKRAFGARLREARESAQITQSDAADKMGFAQQVQLSNMEAGNRMPTLRVQMLACELYGTTMDFLCGFTDDVGRDPVLGAQAMVAAQVSAEVRHLVGALVQSAGDAVRAMAPNEAEQLRLAAVVLEIDAALGRVRQSGAFDELPHGNRLLCKIQVAAGIAVACVERAARLDVRSHARQHAAAAVRGFTTVPPLEEVPAGYSLGFLRPLAACAFDDEPEHADGTA